MLYPFVILSVIITAVIGVFGPLRSYELLWLIPIAMGVLLALILLNYAFIFIIAPFINKNKEQKTNNRFFRFYTENSVGILLKLLRIKIVCQGLESIPKGNWLLISNHRSAFDPMVQLWALRGHRLAFISKPENFAIPGVGEFIHKCCFLPIDRENPRNALRTIIKAVGYLKNDVVNVGVYPEGTRSRNNELRPFHNGTLQMAQKAGVPIVTSVLYNTEAITKHPIIRSTTVVFKIISVTDAETVKTSNSTELGERLRNDIYQSYRDIKNNMKA